MFLDRSISVIRNPKSKTLLTYTIFILVFTKSFLPTFHKHKKSHTTETGLKQYLDFLIYFDIMEPDTIPVLIPLLIVLIMLWLLIHN